MSSPGADRIQVDLCSAPLPSIAKEVLDPAAGAVLSFVGTVRNNKNGRRVLRIVYEAYPAMARSVLQQIAESIVQKWEVCRVVILHRIGRVEVGEASVAIFVSSPHRAEGFAALRYAIETIKQDVPIWKKEHFEDGEVWVQEGS